MSPRMVIQRVCVEHVQVGGPAEAGAGAGVEDAAEGHVRLVVHGLLVDVHDAGGDAARAAMESFRRLRLSPGHPPGAAAPRRLVG